MEFLYGEELRNTLKREKVMPPERVVRMVSQMAIGLDEAHGRKLVHRDLKPDNIFLCQTSDGDIVKILDFGSVKDKGDTAKKLTVMGTTIGSPFYMAPEQAQGLETLDHRADVWALAAIAYECVTGQVPFKGNNGPSILLEILTKEPVPPSNLGREQKHPVPPTLNRVMAHAFKKNPALRIGSVGAFADALGLAYGLTGTHHDWAVTPQQELGARIQQSLPALMQSDGRATAIDGSADAFFGDQQSLGAMSDPFPVAAGGAPPVQPAAPIIQSAPVYGNPGPYSASGGPSYGGDDLVPMGVPRSNATWIVAALVGGVALLLGVVLVLVIFR
jgi:serine/threonine-protein kinase